MNEIGITAGIIFVMMALTMLGIVLFILMIEKNEKERKKLTINVM